MRMRKLQVHLLAKFILHMQSLREQLATVPSSFERSTAGVLSSVMVRLETAAVG